MLVRFLLIVFLFSTLAVTAQTRILDKKNGDVIPRESAVSSEFFSRYRAFARYDAPNQIDMRDQLPPILNNTYIGFASAYGIAPFSQRDLNGVQATSFQNEDHASLIFIGHYYKPYFAAGIDLLCRITTKVNAFAKSHQIHLTVFDLSLRPTLSLTKYFSLFGTTGIGTISRSGFFVNKTEIVSNTNLAAILVGTGADYSMNPNWHLLAGITYFPRLYRQQPSITYAYAGLYYLFHQRYTPTTHPSAIFHKHLIQLGGFSRSIFNPGNINPFFTDKGYLPIFWSGRVALRNGAWIRYAQNVFHTQKIFSFNWGVSASIFHSRRDNNAFETFSIFPLLRFYFLRSMSIDCYFTYSAAGPTYITRHIIDGTDTGNDFIFQDLMGFGALIGKNKNINMNIKIGHYSNGNLFPKNAGIDIPITLTVGYAFF